MGGVQPSGRGGEKALCLQAYSLPHLCPALQTRAGGPCVTYTAGALLWGLCPPGLSLTYLKPP